MTQLSLTLAGMKRNLMSKRLLVAAAALLFAVQAPGMLAQSSGALASSPAGHTSANSILTGLRPKIAFPSSALLGAWTNTDFATRSMVRLILSPTGGTGILVHGFGACSPTPCNWGTTPGTVYATSVSSTAGVAFTASYNFGFSQVILTGIVDQTLGGPFLNVQEFTKFTDGSGRSNYYVTERFAKVIDRLHYGTGPAIPHAHIEGAGMVLGSRLFDISGSNADCTDTGHATPTRLVDIYNAATNSFTAGSPVNVARDMDPVAAVADTPAGPRGFLIGGAASCGGATVRTVEEYNPITGLWTPLPAFSNLPAALTGYNHCGVAIGSRVYYFQAAGIGVFNANTLTWSVLPASAALSPSSFCKAAVVNSNLVMLTGPGNGSADANSQRILLFTPSTGTVSVASATTAPMAEHAMGYLPAYGQALIAGGDFSGESTVQSIGAGPLVTTALTPLPTTRDDAVSGVIDTFFGPKLYIVGGMSGANTTPPVLVATPVF